MQNTPIQSAGAPQPSLRDRRLSQIFDRTPAAEGLFWYSVVTTGVYCRPTCPARHAHAGNIRIHDTLEEARATGFRPCARCTPEAASQSDRHRAVVEAARRLIEASNGDLSSRALADAVGLSPSHLHKIFRRITGTTPQAYARTCRVARAASRIGSVFAFAPRLVLPTQETAPASDAVRPGRRE